MAIIGLSILVASFTFLCYSHPPSSWRFLSWLRPAALGTRETFVTALVPPDEAQVEPLLVEERNALQFEKQAHLDRVAMPPPPFKKSPPVTSLETLDTLERVAESASLCSPNAVPSNSSPPPPSFPALNSAQRASEARGPPKLNPIPAKQPPLRSPLLLPTPTRSPLPNRGPSMSSTLALPPTHNSIPAKPSKKVVLQPGHSPLDWALLSSSPDANLSGLPPSTPYLRVSPSFLRQFTGRKGKDAWTVLGGKVYNITPYLPFHPGGVPELMKAAGRDGTKLFGEVHPWVNWENMLESCLVGIAVGEEDVRRVSNLEEMD